MRLVRPARVAARPLVLAPGIFRSRTDADRLVRWLVLILVSLPSTAVAAQSPPADGPVWSQIAGWLGAVLATLLGGWAARLEGRLAREARLRAEDVAALESRLETHIGRADARAADMLQKAAANTLALSDLRLEMARALNNHPTKSDFERGIDRLGAQVDAMRDKLETLIAGQRHG